MTVIVLDREMLKRLKSAVGKRRIHTTDSVFEDNGIVWIGGTDGGGNGVTTAQFSLDFSVVWVHPMYLDNYPSDFHEGVMSKVLKEIGFKGKIKEPCWLVAIDYLPNGKMKKRCLE